MVEARIAPHTFLPVVIRFTECSVLPTFSFIHKLYTCFLLSFFPHQTKQTPPNINACFDAGYSTDLNQNVAIVSKLFSKTKEKDCRWLISTWKLFFFYSSFVPCSMVPFLESAFFVFFLGTFWKGANSTTAGNSLPEKNSLWYLKQIGKNLRWVVE